MATQNLDSDEFAALPLTVSLAEFCRWTGLDRWVAMQMRRDGKLATVCMGKKHRYLKSEIARLCHLPQTVVRARPIRQIEQPK